MRAIRFRFPLTLLGCAIVFAANPFFARALAVAHAEIRTIPPLRRWLFRLYPQNRRATSSWLAEVTPQRLGRTSKGRNNRR